MLIRKSISTVFLHEPLTFYYQEQYERDRTGWNHLPVMSQCFASICQCPRGGYCTANTCTPTLFEMWFINIACSGCAVGTSSVYTYSAPAGQWGRVQEFPNRILKPVQHSIRTTSVPSNNTENYVGSCLSINLEVARVYIHTWKVTMMFQIVRFECQCLWFRMHCKYTADLGRDFLLPSGALQALLLALRPSCLGLSSSAAGHPRHWGSHRSLGKRAGLGLWDS